MRKTVILFSLLALFALPALADQPVSAEATPEAVLDQTVETAELPLFLDAANAATPALAGDCAAGAAEVSIFEGAASWHCPFGAPRCFKDDHCDAYCGDPRFGYCFSNGCCGCSG